MRASTRSPKLGASTFSQPSKTSAAIPLQRLRFTHALARPDHFPSLVVPLLGGLAVALLAWGFIELSDEVLDGDTRQFDLMLLRAAEALRATYSGLTVVMRDFSGLGSAAVLTLFTSVTVGYLLLTSKRLMALLVAAAVISGALGIRWLKLGFGRARPASEFAELVAPSLSFPSGHAGISAIVFLTLGALLASTRIQALERAYILSTAALMTVLVGVSRIALGVHWATDVLAGWAFGAAWALVWLLLARRLTSPPR